MKDKGALFIYTLCVLLLSYTSSIKLLALTLLAILILVGLAPIRGKLQVLRNTLFSVMFFTMLISLSYAALTGDLYYFTVINLRVLDIALLTMVFVKTVNLYSALSFSKKLSYLLVLTSSQIMNYRRLLSDFNEALKSRVIEKPLRSDVLNYIKRVLLFFFDKSTKDSVEVYQAMKARGFDID